MSTPSANATTAPRSPRFMVFRNPIAASCTTSILSDMLELVSIRTMRSVGVSVASKNFTCCSTPSSKTEKSEAVSPFTNCLVESVTVTLNGTRLAPLRNTGTGAAASLGTADGNAGSLGTVRCAAAGEAACCADTTESAEITRRGRTATRFTTASLLGSLCKWRSGIASAKNRGSAGSPAYERRRFYLLQTWVGAITCVEAFEELRQRVSVTLPPEMFEGVGGSHRSQTSRDHGVGAARHAFEEPATK